MHIDEVETILFDDHGAVQMVVRESIATRIERGPRLRVSNVHVFGAAPE